MLHRLLTICDNRPTVGLLSESSHVARTLNPTAHALRRDQFVDAMQRLMQTKGYEDLSIQELLDDLGASKGAFYHYFDSKGALLEAVVDRIVDGATGSVAPLLADTTVAAPEKLAGVFSGIASWKNARRDLLLSLLRVWVSDENALVREKFRREAIARMTPMLAPVIAQGMDEGVFTASSPERTARVFVSLLMVVNEVATQLFLARQANTVTVEEVEDTFNAYWQSLERVLGAAPGTLGRIDDATLHLWFDETVLADDHPTEEGNP